MESATARARSEAFLQVLRPLVETYLAFSRRDAQQIRKLGLTQSQFDVIATLGNTEGMSCTELSSRTLVSKGTLTGVLDRLEAKGLLERVASTTDRRSTIIRLTPAGDRLFGKVFPALIATQKPLFERALTRAEMPVLRTLLLKLKESFERED